MKKKSLKNVILGSMAFALSLFGTVQAQTVEQALVDGSRFFYYENEDGTLTITEPSDSIYNNGSKIPAEINGKPVTVIGEKAYRVTIAADENKVIYHVTLPDSVKKIEAGAFNSVGVFLTLSDSVSEIEEGAFVNCGIVDFTVPASQPYFATIDNVLFEKSTKKLIYGSEAWCEDNYYEIPEGIREIGSLAFWDKNLTVRIPNTVTSIHDGAFYECAGIDLEEGNQAIWIEDYTWLTDRNTNTLLYCIDKNGSETIPEGIERIGAYSCRKMENSFVFIPESVREIGDYAFEESSLYELTLPSSVEKIGKCAFMENNNLVTVSMSENMKEIGDYAFYGSGKVDSIWLPDTLDTLGEGAFYSCGLRAVNIPEKITEIKKRTFSSGNLEYVEFNENLEIIGSFAFAGAELSDDMVLPDSLKEIGEKAFIGNNLGEIRIPDSVEYIGEGAFEYDTVLVVTEGSYAESWVNSKANTAGVNLKYVSSDDWLYADLEEPDGQKNSEEEEYEEEDCSPVSWGDSDDGALIEEVWEDETRRPEIEAFLGKTEGELMELVGESPYYSEDKLIFYVVLFDIGPGTMQITMENGISVSAGWVYSEQMDESAWREKTEHAETVVSEKMTLESASLEETDLYTMHYWEQENRRAYLYTQYEDGTAGFFFEISNT